MILSLVLTLLPRGVFSQYHLIISCHSEPLKPSPQNFATFRFLPFCHNMRGFGKVSQPGGLHYCGHLSNDSSTGKKIDIKIFLSVKMALIRRGYNFGSEKKFLIVKVILVSLTRNSKGKFQNAMNCSGVTRRTSRTANLLEGCLFNSLVPVITCAIK